MAAAGYEVQFRNPATEHSFTKNFSPCIDDNVESEAQSEGQLTMDAIEAFREIQTSNIKIYHWPIEKRERNQAGRPGKLHMKCAIIDDVAIISSANLTDDAFNRNMELGVIIKEPLTVSNLSDHFSELIYANVLVPVKLTP